MTKHVENNSNQHYTKGNISQGISPKLVPYNIKISQMVLTGPTPTWGSLSKEIKRSSDSACGSLFINHDTNSMKSSASRPSGSISNGKTQHEMNSLKPSPHPPMGSISNGTTPFFAKQVTMEEKIICKTYNNSMSKRRQIFTI